ncbi:MAG: hypothetical protein AB7O66_08160 [Limisphaerales bacterium]
MKSTLLASLAFLLALSPCPWTEAADPVGSPSVQAILDRYVEASGGRAALEKLKTRVSKGKVEVTTVGLSGGIEVKSKVPNKHLSSVDLAGFGAVREGFDGGVSWSDAPGVGLREKPAAELARDRRSKVFPRELKLREAYERLEAKGTAKVDGADAWVIEGSVKGGKPDRLYFDKKTGLLVREESTVDSGLGDMSFQVDFLEYKDVDGVKVPHLIRIPKPESMGFQIRFDEVRHNVEVAESEFSKPK